MRNCHFDRLVGPCALKERNVNLLIGIRAVQIVHHWGAVEAQSKVKIRPVPCCPDLNSPMSQRPVRGRKANVRLFPLALPNPLADVSHRLELQEWFAAVKGYFHFVE